MGDDMRRIVLDERGLTLAEILVAVAIIGIGLVGLAVVIRSEERRVGKECRL